MSSIRELAEQLRPDPWRVATPFSPDVAATHEVLFAANSRDEKAAHLNDWLAKQQPCLFGKIAAKHGLMRYCILIEDDLAEGDALIQQRIQKARSHWWADAFEGRASGFVIAAISERLASCEPGPAMLAFAQRLCALYLLQDVEPDRIYTDTIYLEKPGSGRRTWKWGVGANYFASHADGRWWRDHRVPGGIAFSMNSVGHMVKAGMINQSMMDLDTKLGDTAEEWGVVHVDSLPKALVLAMRTIANAADTPSGRATRLFEVTEVAPSLPCPVELPPGLHDKNHC